MNQKILFFILSIMLSSCGFAETMSHYMTDLSIDDSLAWTSGDIGRDRNKESNLTIYTTPISSEALDVVCASHAKSKMENSALSPIE